MTRAPLPPVEGRAAALLQRGLGADAAALLAPLLSERRGEAADRLRPALAEAWLLQGRLSDAEAALGPAPELRPLSITASAASALWRLHGRVSAARGDVSRAIARHERAQALAAAQGDTLALGLAHYELALCYKQVGEAAVVRDHIAEAAAALHAAGDLRHLALTHSLAGIMHAQQGDYDRAEAALAHAARLATDTRADDVCGIVAGNQAALALLRHRLDEALAFAEEAVQRQARCTPCHGQAPALATLGQICIRMGRFARADTVLADALRARTELRHREVTGAVHDSLCQLALLTDDLAAADAHLTEAANAYGVYGTESGHWYQWSLRVIGARLALGRGDLHAAAEAAASVAADPAAPPADSAEALLVAADVALAQHAHDETDRRLSQLRLRLSPESAPLTWAEMLRLRARLRLAQGRADDARDDLAQSISLCELVRAPFHAERSRALLAQAHAVLASAPPSAQTAADDRTIQRLVDAAALPEWLARELVAVVIDDAGASLAVVAVSTASGDMRLEACSGIAPEDAGTLLRQIRDDRLPADVLRLDLGLAADGPRSLLVRAAEGTALRNARLALLTTVAQQGFALGLARSRAPRSSTVTTERTLTPDIPGFISASAAMAHVLDQVQRLQRHDLTVLITGESGTGKELVARAIHAGSRRRHATLLPYNCTTTSRDLADSQLFGHRRGAFTGAVSDHRGLMQAASGGTLFLDEVGDLPLDVQPKLLRVLEQGEVLPVGETRPVPVDVRVLAATNADLEQRVANGTFRDDLFYRLNVIRLRVPPLRERREEVPHLASFFLRDAGERLGVPDLELGADALEALAAFHWPGNVRQLRNEIQRAVTMATPGTSLSARHLSPELTAPRHAAAGGLATPSAALPVDAPLATLVERLERQVIADALSRHAGNVSETARVLGLTRRGLYLKMRRLGLGSQDHASG